MNRPHTVSFAEPASSVGPPLVEDSIAAAPSGSAGHGAFTRKRGTTESQEGTMKAKRVDAKKRTTIPDVNLRDGLFFDGQDGAWCGMHALNNYCLKGRLVQQEDCCDVTWCNSQDISITTTYLRLL